MFPGMKAHILQNKINDRVIALPISEIKKIKNVIGITFGERKLKVTTAVLRGNTVNILIIDRSIAEKIVNKP